MSTILMGPMGGMMGGWGKAGKGFGGMSERSGPYSGGGGGKGPQIPSANLYVVGLPGGISQEQLVQVFSGYGTVVRSKILGAKDGSAAALVEYQSTEEATMIKDMLSGNIPEGLESPITIRFAEVKDGGKGAMKGGGMAAAMSNGEPQPNDNLYVTGIPEGYGQAEIAQMFAAYGNVTSTKVLGVKYGKAAAMVRLSSIEEAMKVKMNCDGQVLQGCTDAIKIAYADSAETKAMKQMGKGGGKDMMGMAMYTGMPAMTMGKGCGGMWDGGKGMGKGKGGEDMNQVLKAFESSGGLPGGTGYNNSNQTALYVAGLPPNCEEIHLYRLFAPFGAIAPKGCRVMVWPDSGMCKGFGFVNYLDPAAAQLAIESISGAVLPSGTVMKVSLKTDKGEAAAAPTA